VTAMSRKVGPDAPSSALNSNEPLRKILAEIEPRFAFQPGVESRNSEVEPRYSLQPGVEELLLDMATDFVADVTEWSGRLAKHRRATQVDARDVQLVLDKNYGISIAAMNRLHSLPIRPKPSKSSVHMHRVALKRKVLDALKTKQKQAKH
jgi:transcription initiation factor TFIID subunit TAF12